MSGPRQWVFDADVLARDTVWASTDSEGLFAFSTRPPGSDQADSAIWATHPGFEAGVVVLAAEEAPEAPVALALQAREGMWVEVVTGQGEGVPGAEVLQRALVPDPARTGTPLVPSDLARFVLFRTQRTSADGSTLLPPIAGEQRVQARHLDVSSVAWQGPTRARLTLELLEAFTVGGLVRVSGEGELEDELQVAVLVQDGNILHTVDRIPVDPASLRWGPASIPLTRFDRLALRVEGGDVVPELHFVKTPTAGAHEEVLLEVSLGHFLYFQMRNEEGETLFVGQADVTWFAHGEELRASAQPHEEGYIQVRGLPTGVVQPRFTSPGYALTQIHPLTLPQEEVFVDLVTLYRAAALEGRCVADGQPVTDFELLFWPSNYPASFERLQVTGSEDGSFRIETAPLGQMSIAAAAPDRPRSEIHQVHVSPNGTPSLLIELPAPESMRGRVVNESGEPLGSAVVQLHSCNGSLLLGPWGPPIPVRPDGTFEVRGLSPGRSFFELSAPEYSTRKVGAEVTPGEVLDLGALRLVPRQSLEVRLAVAPGVDPTSYSISGPADAPALLRTRFDADGRVVFDAVDASYYDLLLEMPDRRLQRVRAELRPGSAWIVEIDATGSARITVRVEGERARSLHPDSMVLVEFLDSASRANARVERLHGELEVAMESLAAGRYTLTLRDGMDVAATQGLDLAEGEDRRVVMHLDGRDVRVRVVDARGAALSGVVVHLYDERDSLRYETTDAQGLCTFLGVPERTAWFGLTHPTAGSRWGLPLEDHPDADGAVELVLDAEARFELRLLDGTTPVESISCQLRDPLRHIGVTVSVGTDPDGRAVVNRVAEGSYSLLTFHEAYWPMEADVTVAAQAELVTLQVRRRGDLTFEVRTPEGAPVAGARPRLESLEFATDVASWSDAERIEVHPAGGASDSNGRIAFRRLPRGPYRWSLPNSDGSPTTGTVEVLGGQGTVAQLIRQ